MSIGTFRYTPYYCEENVYWLAREPRFAPSRREVVFVSNEARSVALFHQRAAASPLEPVIWDYHVVLAVHGPEGVEVWDLDCTAGAPLSATRWLALSFPLALPQQLSPRFRVVEANAFVASFSSDRSHMRSPDGTWYAPEPEWPPIVRGAPNLMRFVDPSDPIAGEILDLEALRVRWR